VSFKVAVEVRFIHKYGEIMKLEHNDMQFMINQISRHSTFSSVFSKFAQEALYLNKAESGFTNIQVNPLSVDGYFIVEAMDIVVRCQFMTYIDGETQKANAVFFRINPLDETLIYISTANFDGKGDTNITGGQDGDTVNLVDNACTIVINVMRKAASIPLNKFHKDIEVPLPAGMFS
jgi:hypothetical protein